MQDRERNEKYKQIIVKCLADKVFKADFMSDPAKVLKENGLEIRDGVKLHVVENTETDCYLVIPAKQGPELTDDQLDRIAGAGIIGAISKLKAHKDNPT